MTFRAVLLVGSVMLGTVEALAPRAAAAAPSQAEAMYLHYTRGFDKLNGTGEQFCWNNAFGLPDFLEQYQASGDVTYLDWGVKYYDALLGKMAEGPDGYKGWIGPYIYNSRFKGKYWCDVHVGDAILFGGILDFAYTVTRDPQLKARYGSKALEYVEQAKRNLIEKWDARGTWTDAGAFGCYVSWDKYGQPGQYKDWAAMPAEEADAPLTLPFNKQMDVGVCAMRIWQITGGEKYRHRAEQIFGNFKSRLQAWNDCYHWNYWEPGGQWDLSGDAEHPFRHWINTHGERNYQEGEVVNIVKAYNAGIVFTEADMRAIVNTNTKVMWNGDLHSPRWANSNADLHREVGKPEAYDVAKPGRAGIVWAALAQMDPTERSLVADWVAGLKSNSGRNDTIILYFNNVTAKTPPSFERRDVAAGADVNIPAVYGQFPMGQVRTITFAAMLPAVAATHHPATIACKLLEPGDLEIALYSADGKTRVTTLHRGTERGGSDGRDGIFVLPFDGVDPATGKAVPPGEYRVRWTIAGDGYREFPITIQGEK
jgi:hypothetical protein